VSSAGYVLNIKYCQESKKSTLELAMDVMEEKSIAAGNMLHATFRPSNLNENLSLVPSKKILEKWR
jgi:hypothetical protein